MSAEALSTIAARNLASSSGLSEAFASGTSASAITWATTLLPALLR